MNQTPKSPQQQAREARLAAALRDNLKRRKAQARGRTASENGEQAPPDHLPVARKP
ncbi:MAG: hypothetical protein ACRCXM_11810 [Beijerinckiaceae bacterium]